jgi:hypothetical protein
VKRPGLTPFVDTDSDGWEIDIDLVPLGADDALDADGDLFTNHMEFLMGTEPMIPPTILRRKGGRCRPGC